MECVQNKSECPGGNTGMCLFRSRRRRTLEKKKEKEEEEEEEEMSDDGGIYRERNGPCGC